MTIDRHIGLLYFNLHHGVVEFLVRSCALFWYNNMAHPVALAVT